LLLWDVTFGGRSLIPYDALVADPAFRPALEAAGIRAPQNGLVADLVLQNLPWKSFLRAEILRGHLPLWNPAVLGGVPFLAAGQASPLHPSSLLFLVLPIDAAFGAVALLNLWFAALGMTALGRALRLGWGPAVMMGLVWSLSSLFVVNAVFPMIQAAMAATPLLLAGIESLGWHAEDRRAATLPEGGGALWCLGVAAATALVALAGHPEMLMYAGLTAGGFALFRTALVHMRAGNAATVRFLAWTVGAAVAGLLVAGVQIVPQVELARASFRASAAGRTDYAEAVGHSFPAHQILSFVLPDAYGNPSRHTVREYATGMRRDLPASTMWGTAYPDGAGWRPTKNYVEAAAYLGILPLLLAAVGLFGTRRRERWFFGASAALALSFVFGLPTYRLLFALPGIEQLRTPFRWVFPFCLAVTVLAGFGADRLSWRRASGTARVVAALALAAGAAAAGIVVVTYLEPSRWVTGVTDALARVTGAEQAVLSVFPDTGTFAGYLYSQVAHLATFLLLAGAAILILARERGGRAAWLLIASVAAGDLLIVGRGFNPAVDPRLGAIVPPAVTVLRDATDVKWGRVVGVGDEKVLWPNTLQRFEVPDLRGYESIVPEWTAAALSAAEDQSGWLKFNRIGNLTSARLLEHPLLRAAGARYAVSATPLEQEGLVLLHAGDVLVYENPRALPRAWVVPEVRVVSRAELPAALDELDPETTVLLEEAPAEAIWTGLPAGRPLPAPPAVVRTSASTELVIDVYSPASAMLVVSDAYFPGWRAWVASAVDAAREPVEVPVFRADGMLRAVPIPAGRSTVRLAYFPLSAKLGLFASFVGVLGLLVVAAYALWRRYVDASGADELGRIAVNSFGPMAIALFNKVVDFAFAMVMLRLLGPAEAGMYYTAITVIAFAEIFTNFGLNLFTTREVARRPDEAPVFLVQTSIIRLALWLVVLPGLAGYVLFRAATGSPLTSETVVAVALLAVALVPGNLNTALSSVFQAFERMMVPAAVSIVSNFARVALGTLALLGGAGVVGLAGVAIAVNWVTFGILAVLLVREGVRPALQWRPDIARNMALVSLPFMLNHLLQTVFFKIDVLLLSQMLGDTVVGWYSAAYKWVDALLIIPAYVTLALFPMMSRRAVDDREGLRDAFVLATRWLIALALPIAMVTTVLAEPLIEILAGGQYLPAGAIALSIMIWFLPLSFLNGVTQYVLIALDRQRWITPSFAVAVTFNLAANFWAIPRYGYQGAAVVTILSEAVLLIPFWWGVRDLGAPPPLAIIWRPALAASAMGVALARLDIVGVPPVVAAAIGGVVYVAVLRAVGGVTDADRRILGRLLRRPTRRPAPTDVHDAKAPSD
jgi:O-antigen/teichoic acid export membrane protein